MAVRKKVFTSLYVLSWVLLQLVRRLPLLRQGLDCLGSQVSAQVLHMSQFVVGRLASTALQTILFLLEGLGRLTYRAVPAIVTHAMALQILILAISTGFHLGKN